MQRITVLVGSLDGRQEQLPQLEARVRTLVTDARISAEVLIRSVLDVSLFVDGSGGPKVMLDDQHVPADSIVAFQGVGKYGDIASAAVEQLVGQAVHVLDAPVLRLGHGKLWAYARLAKEGVPIPETAFFGHSSPAENATRLARLGDAVVVKANVARRGNDNQLFNSAPRAYEWSMTRLARGERVVAQRFVQNDGDLRLLVVAGEVVVAVHRRAQPGSHLNNVSAGAVATVLRLNEVPSAVTDLAVRAAAAVGLDIAGVDVIEDKASGQFLVLEVNRSPQLLGAYDHLLVAPTVAQLVRAFHRNLADT